MHWLRREGYEMRLERLNYNKIKNFLTFDDLSERGLTKEDLWRNAPKVQQLFRDMMQANKELGFEADGPIAVEVFSLQALKDGCNCNERKSRNRYR